MREHKINELNNFIMGFYIDDDKLCEDIIEFHKTSKTRYEGVTEYLGVYKVDKTVKDSIDVILNENADLKLRYTNHLQNCINAYIKKYPWCNEYGSFADLEITNIQYYPANGGYFQWHTERGNGKLPCSARHLVFMTYLNDVTDAGETEFFHQKLKISPERGLTLLWGSDWTFTHRGIASPSQEKYITTGWLSFFH